MLNDVQKRNLTPQQIQQEEYVARALRAEKDRIIFDEDKDEMMALASDPLATHTANGRIIRRHGSVRAESSKKGIFCALFGDAGENGIIIDGIQSAFKSFMKAVTAPATPILVGASSEAGIQPHNDLSSLTNYNDDNCIIEMERVSLETASKLEEENDEIEAKVRELAGIKDPVMRQELAEKIIELASEYQMKEHPQFPGHYIHTADRVEQEENLINARGLHTVTAEICVYRVKCEIGDDTVKGINRKIGDVLNNNPEEVQLNVDEVVAKAASAQLPAPGLHLT